jgi:hypothetical protein
VNLATIGWPSGTDTGWPSEPRNMLPGRIEGYPQGSQRSANTAERLLSQAVGWWDAAAYREGDRMLRNRGVAGELLDLQLGSSDRVATTNDPLFLAPEESGYVYLPGVNGNVLRVPDEAALDITGDIDIRFHASYDVFPQTLTNLVSKWNSAADGGGYLLGMSGSLLRLAWINTDGTVAGGESSTVTPPIVVGVPIWIRTTLDVDNGAGQYEVKFFTSEDGSSWTQLGSTKTGTTGVTAIGVGTNELAVGGRAANRDRTITGKAYRAVIYSDLTETTKVLDIDCDAITDGSATSFTAVTNQTVRIMRSTSGRKSVAVPSRSLKKWDDPHVFLPGVNGNFLSVPDAAALDITGDLDIRVKVALANWTPAAVTGLVSKWLTTGNQRSYSFRVVTNGRLRLVWSENGTAEIVKDSAFGTFFGDGSAQWVRVTLDVDNGASGNDVKFFTSNDGVNWIQFGTTVTTAGVTSVYSSTADLSIGQVQASTNMAAGRFYQSVIYSDLTETTKVLDIDCAKAPTNFTAGNALTFLADTGQTVTLNSTAGSGMEVRGTRFSSGRSLFLLGFDDYFQIPLSNGWQHQLLNFNKNDPFTIVIAVRAWSTQVGNRFISKFTTNPLLGWAIDPNDANNRTRFLLYERSDVFLSFALAQATGNGSLSVKVGSFNQPNYSIQSDSFSQTSVNRGLDLRNQSRTMIGSQEQAAGGLDMEFTAAAVFRRALTPDEIKTITDYYQNRGY